MTPHLVTRDAIPARWPDVAWMLHAALLKGHGEINIEQLRLLLIQGRAKLLVALDEASEVRGAMAVEFIDYPNYRVGHVIAIGGRGLADDAAAWQQVKDWLKREGCTCVQGFANDAIARLWKRQGMKTVYQVVRDEL